MLEEGVLSPNIGVILFTAIEIVTMLAWLALVMAGYGVAGFIVLVVGLYAEHVVSYNVGTGQPFFRFPPRKP